MKRIFLLLSLAFLASMQILKAQVSGIINIPNEATLNTTITNLNNTGVGAGGATLNFTAGFSITSTKQLGSATLNASLSSSNPLILDGNNFTINGAFAGTRVGSLTTGANDALFVFSGTDYVTIREFTFTEQASNTTNTTAIDNALSFYNRNSASPFDGCQYITIENCTFNLSKSNNAAAAIFSGPYQFNSGTALSWGTFGAMPSDMNREFIIQNNTFNGSYNHIVYRGSTTANGRAVQVLNNTMNNIGGGSATSYGFYCLYLDSIIFNGNTAATSLSQTTTNYIAFASTNSGGFQQANGNNITLQSGVTTSQTAGIWFTSVGQSRQMNGNTINIGSFPNITSGTIYGIYGTYSGGNAPITLEMNNNICTNQSLPPSTGLVYLLYNSGSVAATNDRVIKSNNNTITNINKPSSGTFYPIYTLTADTIYTCGNTISDISMTNNTASGTSTMAGIFSSSSSVKHQYAYGNNISNISFSGSSSSTAGVIRGIYSLVGTTASTEIYDNNISGLTIGTGTTTGSIFGVWVSGNGVVHRNKIYNLSAAQVSGSVAGVFISGGTTSTIYNNMISDLRAPNASGAAAITGINTSGGTNANVYHNTIYLGSAGSVTSTGSDFGGAGLLVSSSVATEVINNIINIAGTANGTGYFAALKRSGGTAGLKPANLNAKNNIYYAPYIYGEGNVLTTATNVFHTGSGSTGTLDAVFNTPCSPYKTFMLEAGTFQENNLNVVSSGVYAPLGSSYAESGAFSPTVPPINEDFSSVIRGATPDIGALEFAGSGTDATGPAITYTNIGTQHCLVAPSLATTINDANGVNIAPGLVPRLYFKKSSELNAYNGNSSANNGWKYVESFDIVSPFNFTIDYSLLNSPVAPGDVIEYFVVAEDNAPTPNVGNNTVTFNAGFCPTTVDLAAGAFPVSGVKSYTINVVSSSIIATPSVVCTGSPTTTLAVIAGSGTAQLGSGTLVTSTYAPYNGSTTNARRVQYLIPASELTAAGYVAGPITQVGFDIAAVPTGITISGFTLKMGNTTAVALSSAFSPDASTTVFTGSYSPVAGINTHAVSGFSWDGTSNIILEACHGIVGTASAITIRYASGTPTQQICYSTTNTGCATASGTVTTARPNIYLTGQKIIPGLTYTWNDGISSLGTGNPKVSNPTFPSGAMTYSVTATDGICTFTATTLITQNTSSPSISSASVLPVAPCFGDSVTLAVNVSGGCPPYSYAFTFTPTGGSATPITLSGTNKYLPNVSGTFDVTVTDITSQNVSGTVGTITMLAPPTTTGDTRCGTGTVSLTATGSGAGISWYTNPTGGVPIASGSPFTPTVSTTTTFYAATGNTANYNTGRQVTGGGSGNALTAVPRGLIFTTTQPLTINTLGFMSCGPANNITLQLWNSGGTAQVGSNIPVTLPASAGTATAPVLVNVPVSIPILTPGTYRLFVTTYPTTSPATLFYEFSLPTSPYPYTSGGLSITSSVTSLTGAASLNTYYYIYNIGWSEGCGSSRTPAVATVNPAPALSITASNTICNNEVRALNVTSNVADYDTYTWSPNTNLFENAACTIPYTGSNLTTVYIKSATASVNNITLTATNNTTLCSNTANTTITVMPPSTIAASPTSICFSGSTVLSLTPASGYGTGTIQWQVSSSGAPATYSNIPSANAPTYTSPTITSDKWYGVEFKDGDGNICALNPTQHIVVNTPTVVSSAGGTACIGSSTTLTATPSAGADITWYDAAVLGNIVGTGNSYTTPNLTATTTYYAEPSVGGTGGTASPIVITEIDPGSTDFIEIQNVSGAAFDATGWKVFVSNSYTSITDVNPISQTLGNMAAGQIISWTDATAGPNYWGNNLFWNPGAYPSFTGWAAIVDNNNVLRDFVVMNWPASIIASANINMGGFVHAVGSKWTGNGVDITTVPSTSSVQRIGTLDNNTNADFAIQTQSIGTANTGLTVPQLGYGCQGTRVPVVATVSGLCPPQVTVTAIIQGYWDGAAGMVPVMTNQSYSGSPAPAVDDVDDVTIQLCDGAPNYTVQHTFTGRLKTNGTVVCTFPPAANGNSYYIVVNHRNSIQTWSKNPVLMSDYVSYNFTTDSTKAAGNNLININGAGLYAIYNGDLDGDTQITGLDALLLDFDVDAFTSGYITTDLDGDGSAAGFDYLVLDPNIANSVELKLP